MNRTQVLFLIVSFLLCLTACITNDATTKNSKLHPNDPFQKGIVNSQFFSINTQEDQVIEGEKGTVLVIPRGSLLNAKGEEVLKNVQIELAEALELDEMILSNLTTTSNGELLETDGMIYFSATADGKELQVNPENPIYIEIPTTDKKPGMKAYKGIRDEEGNMNWVNPRKLEEFLVTVDINQLDFYPRGFEQEVVNGMPFRNHKEADKSLIDSLYYSLSIKNQAPIVNELEKLTEINEPYFDNELEVVDGEYVERAQKEELNSLLAPLTEGEALGIDPAIIKAIWSEEYQNTFIATREFEARLRVIFETCREDILEIYIQNLDKNLWECDSMVVRTLLEHNNTSDFYDFYLQRKGKVKEANKYAKILKGHYEKRIKKIRKKLKMVQKKAAKELEKKNQVAERTIREYKEVLFERETQRMETYGFEWTETGWINIDIGIIPKEWGSKRMAVEVENGAYYDQLFTYLVFPSMNSITRMNVETESRFYAGSLEEGMKMPNQKKAVCISIAYIEEQSFIAIQEFITGTDYLLQSMDKASEKEIKQTLKPYSKFGSANDIEKDIEYMQQLKKEEERREALRTEQIFINKLKRKAYACCFKDSSGEALFKSYCASCHSPRSNQLIGPGLASVSKKYDMKWLIQFTQNSGKMISERDPRAVRIYQQYNKVAMPAQPVNEAEVKRIFDYIDSLSNDFGS